jgi:uncharacterized protein (TIRG00374 family)
VTPTRWLLTALSFLVAIGASVWLVWRGWPAQGGTLSLPWWVHGLSLAIMLAEAAMRSAKLVLAGRALGAPLSFGTGLRTVLGGDFAAAITPSRSGSEPARFMVLTAARVPVASIILLLFVELFMEGLSIALVAVVLTLLFHGEGRAISGILVLAAGYGATVVAVGVVGSMLARRYASGPAPHWARRIRLDALRWRAVQRSLHQLQLGMDALRHARAVPLLGALAVSVLHVVLRLCALPAIVLPLAPETPLAPLVLWPLVLFYGSVVAPVPGGGGAVELAFTTVLKGTIPPAIMGRALVWWRLYGFYGYVVLGALATGRTALRALRGVESIETADEERKQRMRWRGRRR